MRNSRLTTLALTGALALGLGLASRLAATEDATTPPAGNDVQITAPTPLDGADSTPGSETVARGRGRGGNGPGDGTGNQGVGPRDGTGNGAKRGNGGGTGPCDGTGPKGRGRGRR
jgi:hypothetical protein